MQHVEHDIIALLICVFLGCCFFFGTQAAVMLVKNGEMVATVWAESIPYWATSTNVAVLSLAQGDQIWVLLLTRASFLHGYMYTTLSGFLIFDQN